MAWDDIKTAKIEWQEQSVPQSRDFDDIYYSTGSGLAESCTVFLNAVGLPEAWMNRSQFTIGETGFGTGLNFLATWELWKRTKPSSESLDYISVEQFPMEPADLTRALSAFPELQLFSDQLIAHYPPPEPGYHQLVFPNDNIRLTLMLGPAEAMLARQTAPVDAWYLDGFAPSKNPEMWSRGLFEQIARLSSPDARLATFSAASGVRRGLEAVGFKISRKKGFGKKRERIEAARQKERIVPSPAAARPTAARTVTIIGAGIAGCCLAFQLNTRGFEVRLIDSNNNVSDGIAGNLAALISPKLILGNDPYGRFLAAAYLFATKYYDDFQESPWLEPRGLLSIAVDAADAAFQKKLLLKHRWSGDQQRPLDAGIIEDNWGLKNGFGGLLYEKAGSIDVSKLMNLLKYNANIEQRTITSIKKGENHWNVDDDTGETLRSDILVIASGLQSYDLISGLQSPFIANRGQVVLLDAARFPDDCPSLAFAKYLTAPFDNGDGQMMRLLGATYKRTNETSLELSAADQEKLMVALAQHIRLDAPISGAGRVGFRATTIDHMPVMGLVPDIKAIATLPSHRQKVTPGQLSINDRLPDLYLFAGLASRGFQTAPLLAASLAAMIDGTPQPLDTGILNALDPARFPLHSRKMQLST